MALDLDTFDPVRGPAREPIDAQEMTLPDDRAAVVLDRRRRQPSYFDDRYLTARDLTRDQQYRLLRQADLAQLSGAGVVRGLEVTSNATGTTLHVALGAGIARSGESIIVRDDVSVAVNKLRVVSRRPDSRALVATNAATAAQTGLFVLTAFPVEHARAPALAFANGTIDPKITDTEIAESTWFGLVPLATVDAKEVSGQGRARVAREVFVGGFDPNSVSDGLGIALLGIAGGRVQWIDRAIVVRRVGGDAVLGLGLQRRKVRVAFQEQYAEHLEAEVARRRGTGLSEGLAAAEAFQALPPVGPLPRGAVVVTTTEVRQTFFPRELYVEMAIVPEDEVPALLSEGLTNAPIDLKLPPEALEGVPVLIVIPVPRTGYDRQTPRMAGTYRGPKLAVTGRPLSRVRPIDALAVLRAKNEVPVVADPVPLDLEAWRKAVESAPRLWYVRRQQFSTTSVVIPRSAPGEPSEGDALENLESVALTKIVAAGEGDRFNRLFDISSPEAIEAMNELIGNQLTGSPEETSVLVSGIMGELSYMARRPRPSEVTVDVASITPVMRRTATGESKSPAAPPQSPAFAEQASNRLAVRPLELFDVQRVAARFAARDVGDAFREDTLQAVGLRSVLSASVVVPELAVWSTTPAGQAAGGVEAIAKLAGLADVEALRGFAKEVTLLPPLPEVPPPLPRTAEVDSMMAIRSVAHPDFMRRLTETLAVENLGDQPLMASWILMRLLVVGFELPRKTDADVEALFESLRAVAGGEGKFVAPNGNSGEILAEESHSGRDAVLRQATKVPANTVVKSQQRLRDAGFVSDESTEEQNLLAHRLLALATTNTNHVELIAQAKAKVFANFMELALEAVAIRSVVAMRRAVQSLKPTE